MKIHLAPSDPGWAVDFGEEASRLRLALAGVVVDVHHIGSTAIPGIHAKPIIDILLTVQRLSALDGKSDVMAELGYEVLGEFGISARRYFRRTSAAGRRTHHVHAFEHGTPGALRHLAFRDYMNAYPQAAQDYDALKRRLASAFPTDRIAYMHGKREFVDRHEAIAMAWMQSRKVHGGDR